MSHRYPLLAEVVSIEGAAKDVLRRVVRMAQYPTELLTSEEHVRRRLAIVDAADRLRDAARDYTHALAESERQEPRRLAEAAITRERSKAP